MCAPSGFLTTLWVLLGLPQFEWCRSCPYCLHFQSEPSHQNRSLDAQCPACFWFFLCLRTFFLSFCISAFLHFCLSFFLSFSLSSSLPSLLLSFLLHLWERVWYIYFVPLPILKLNCLGSLLLSCMSSLHFLDIKPLSKIFFFYLTQDSQ